MSALKTFLDNVLGVYSPIMYEYSSQNIIPDGFAGVDWPYIIRALVFVVALWSIFRMIGGIVCKM